MLSARRVVPDAIFAALALLAILFVLAAPAFAGPAACERDLCRVDHADTELVGIPLLRGWRLDEAYVYETAGGARASVPTLVIVREPDFVVLNGRQITGARCKRSGADEICITLPVSREAGDQARALAGWRAAGR